MIEWLLYLQLVHTYEGYSEKQNPTEIQTAGCAMRVFALKYHPEYDDIFVTGGWENHLKVDISILSQNHTKWSHVYHLKIILLYERVSKNYPYINKNLMVI